MKSLPFGYSKAYIVKKQHVFSSLFMAICQLIGVHIGNCRSVIKAVQRHHYPKAPPLLIIINHNYLLINK